MPATHVTDRPRTWSISVPLGSMRLGTMHGADGQIEHHAVANDTVSILTIVACVLFLVGSFCFFSYMPEWVLYVGDYCFIVASVINTAIAAFAMAECHTEMELKLATAQSSQDGDDSTSEDGTSDASEVDVDKERNEFFESACYFVANVVFAAGCVLFYPGLFKDRNRREYAHEWGAWAFIIGSFGFVIAAYWNALGLSNQHANCAKPKSGSREALCARMASWELMLSMLGSQLFVVGSFLYRPSYDTHCDSRIAGGSLLQTREHSLREHLAQKVVSMLDIFRSRAQEAPAPAAVAALCVNVTDQGTWMYVIGSGLFVVQSVLHLVRGILMHGAVAEPAASGMLVKGRRQSRSGRRQSRSYTIV